MSLKLLLWINISLFYVHELDAVRTREWRMMVTAETINDETLYRIFAVLYIPLIKYLLTSADHAADKYLQHKPEPDIC